VPKLPPTSDATRSVARIDTCGMTAKSWRGSSASTNAEARARTGRL
jgi:hypothetical protein